MAKNKESTPKFDSEEDFIRFYLSISDKRQQNEEIERYIESNAVNGMLRNVDKHRLTRIQDPFAKVTHYSLDDGWRIVENPSFHGQKSEYDDLYSTSE